ncbi:protein phosphatase 1 regulatory subunit 15A [Emydura macquarii macquarii]|uniref:protein phosphatase 1 regulatory subunit 15A n=1 Tax=Emydura macquarii macquarii TaxID=1129001 RepID=UPI00352B2FB4
MLCVTSPQPGGLLDAFMGAPGLLLGLLGYWRRLPAALMRRKMRKMRRRKMRMKKMRRRMKKMRRRMRRRRGRQRRKSRGPTWPRVWGRAGGHHGLPPPLQEHLEYLQEGEDLAAGSGQLEEGPAASQGPAPRRGKGENLGGGPRPGARAPSASSDREVGGSLGEDPKRRGEEATARPGMEKHLEEVGDGQKQLRGGPARPRQDGEHLGTGGKPEGGLEPHGGDAACCPRGDADPGRPITKNPLVLSFFYCPSEEEEEEEEEEDDWLSDEEGNAGGSVCSEAGAGRGCSGTDWTDSEAEPEDEARREENEAFWGALRRGHDPFNPLRLATAPTPPRPKDREFRVSFYLRAPTSAPETVGDPWSPPKKPWPMRRGTHCTTHRCEMGSRGVGDPGKAENLDSGGNRAAKKVRFSPVVTVHPLLVWPFASRAARRGPWEELARDRSRFHRRIEQLEAVLGPCLEAEHQARAWRKIHGAAPEPAEQGLPFPLHKG